MYYSIEREEEFDERVKEIAGSFERMDEIDRNIDWALAREPYFVGQHIYKDYYLWETERFTDLDIPQVVILYTVDSINKKILLIDISVIPG